MTASCNRSEANRHLAHEEGAIQRTYASISEMLEKERPHGVVCCPSYDSMFEVASEILPFGIPTFLEKPPGLSLQQAVNPGRNGERIWGADDGGCESAALLGAS